MTFNLMKHLFNVYCDYPVILQMLDWRKLSLNVVVE
jgi:hypothetical protein